MDVLSNSCARFNHILTAHFIKIVLMLSPSISSRKNSSSSVLTDLMAVLRNLNAHFTLDILDSPLLYLLPDGSMLVVCMCVCVCV